MNRKQKVVIVGAGPAGLSVAYRLLQGDGAEKYEVIVLEVESDVGGISKTIDYKGNRMDLGGHRFFTKNSEVENFWHELISMPKRPRLSRIYFNNKFFDYPPKLNFSTLRKMGFAQTVMVGTSYLKSVFFKLPDNSLENFYINRFGRKLYTMFFKGYTEKLWGVDASKIAPDWGTQRVKGLSITKVIMNFCSPRGQKEVSLIEEFYYPERGPGQMYQKLARKIEKMGGRIITGALVDRITASDGRITRVQYIKDGRRRELVLDWLISSMPVKDLIESMRMISTNVVPAKVVNIAQNLPYRDFRTVGILVSKVVRELKDTWIYVQEPNIKMGRIQVFNNWSPQMVRKNNTVWLGLEYFCNEGDQIWSLSDKDFFELASEELERMGFIRREDILDYHSEKIRKAYPAYFGSYKDFSAVREFLDTIPNLYCVGRNGQHRYNNMDHSILTGFRAADDIKNERKNKDNIWSVNTEKEYHEEK